MSSPFETKSAAILIVESLAGVRPIMTSSLREVGFKNITSVESLNEAINILEVETIDWLITSFFHKDDINALQIMALARKEPALKNMYVSLFVTEEELSLVPKAFSLGLLSVHEKPFNQEKFLAEINEILEKIFVNDGNTSIVSAEYLRPILKSQRSPATLLKFEQALHKKFPAVVENLLALSEAYFLNGDMPQARSLLWQVTQREPELTPMVEELNTLYSKSDDETDPPDWHAFELKQCLIVDSDSLIQDSLKKALEICGAQEVFVFDNGEKCWEWLKENDAPDLIIMEWRIPGLTAPMIIQRCRAIGLFLTAYIIHSSLVQKKDEPLLLEMGVTDVVRKPFREENILNCIAASVGQFNRPTELKSLEHKIRTHLYSGDIQEANNFMQIFLEKFSDNPSQKSNQAHLEAEFAFASKDFNLAKEKALKSMRLGNNSVSLLNLLGKSLVKLREFQAALRIFQRADDLAPNSIERLCAIAETQVELGESDAALKSLDQINSLDSENPAAINTNVNVGLACGEEEIVRNAIDRFDPADKVMAYVNNKAIAHSRSNEIDQAIALYQNVLTALPNEKVKLIATISYNLALAHARKENVEGIIETLEDIPATDDKTLSKKIASLLSRAITARETNSQVQLTSETVSATEPLDIDAEMDTIDDSDADEQPSHIFCCFDLFVDDEEDEGDLVKSLLSTKLRFKKRKSVVKS